MKQIAFFLLLAANAFSATLDITGWNQERSNGRNTPVKITDVATGESLFFTSTPGVVSSRKIVSTDISNASTLGLDLMTTSNAAAARGSLGLVIGQDVQAFNANLTDLSDGILTGSKVGTGIMAENITSGTINPARLGAGSANSSTYLRGDGLWAVVEGGGTGSSSLPSTRVGFGGPANELTSDLTFTYNASLKRLAVGGLDTSLASTETPTVMSALAVDLSKALNTKTDNASRVITFTNTLSNGQYSGLRWTNTSTSAIAVTLPANVYNGVTGALVSDFIVPAQVNSVPGRKHVVFGNDGISVLIYLGSSSSSGGSGSGFPLTTDANFAGYNATNIGTATAQTFSGSGELLTDLPASELLGEIPDITTGLLTTSKSRVVTPTAGVSNVIVTTNGDTTITLDAAAETLTYSSQPATGTKFEYSLTGHTTDCVVTIPDTYSYATGGIRTSYIVPANKIANIVVKRESSRYVMWGDPIVIGDLAQNNTPTSTAKIEIDAGSGSQFTTLSNLLPAIGAQPLDADLTELATGTLAGSKIGTGINAANITTGLVNPLRLGTGTRDNSTFLRSDGVWSQPPGSSGTGNASLPATYVGFGSGVGELTYDALFNYNSTTKRLTVGGVTTSLANTETPSAMGGLIVDFAKALNTKTDTTSRTIEFTGTLANGQYSGLRWINTGASVATITLPANVYNGVTGALVSSFTVPAQASSVSGRKHVVFGNDGTNILIYLGTGTGSSGSGFPLTANADFGGYNATNIGTVSALTFVGSASGLEDVPASELLGEIPDISTGTLTTTKSRVVTPVAGASNVIVTTNGDTTITLDATTEILTYSSQPATGTRFEYSLTGHTADCTVTIPSTYSFATGTFRTSFVVPANKLANIAVKRESGRYVMWGDPLAIGDLPVNNAPTTASKIEIDNGNGSEYTTLASALASVSGTSLTSTRVGFGGGSNEITSDAAFNYDVTTKRLTVGGVTTSLAGIHAPTAMGALVVDLSKALNTKTDNASRTITFTNSLVNGQISALRWINTSASVATITLPANVYNGDTGTVLASFTVPAQVSSVPGRRQILFGSDGTNILAYTGVSSESGGSGSGFPLTADASFGGYNATDIGTVTAQTFVGSGELLTNLPASELLGTIPDITTGLLTTTKARVVTPVAGASNVIVTTNGDTTITLDAATETLTYSSQPATGTRFEYSLTGHTTDCVVTIPETYSHALGNFRTSFTVPANKIANIVVKRESNRYVMWGDPFTIGNLTQNNAPATTAKIEIDAGNGSEYTTLASALAAAGTTTLTSTRVGFGGSSNEITSDAAFNYSSTTKRLTVGGVTTSLANTETPSVMGTLIVDLTKALNTKSDNASRTIEFTGTLTNGQYSGLRWSNTSASAVVVTLPANVYNGVTGALVTSFNVSPQVGGVPGRRHVVFSNDGTNNIVYLGTGATEIANGSVTGAKLLGDAYPGSANIVNAQTNTTYTLLASDNGRVLTFTNGAATTITVPAGLPVGFTCQVIQNGTGNLLVSASGTTVSSFGGLYNLAGQYAAATLVSTANNTFVLAGNLK